MNETCPVVLHQLALFLIPIAQILTEAQKNNLITKFLQNKNLQELFNINQQIMSRTNNIQKLLGDPELRVKSIKPSGDCFYQTVVEAYLTLNKDILEHKNIEKEPDETPAMALRRTAANAVDDEVFNDFSMFHAAGLPDFSFMRRVRSTSDLRQRMLVSGAGAGAGQCLWANEFEIRVVSSALNIICLILDMQTRDEHSRFVRVGEVDKTDLSQKFIILQRTRREHFNLIYSQTDTCLGLFSYDEISNEVKALWKLK